MPEGQQLFSRSTLPFPSPGGESRRCSAGVWLGPGLPVAGCLRCQQGQIHAQICRSVPLLLLNHKHVHAQHVTAFCCYWPARQRTTRGPLLHTLLFIFSLDKTVKRNPQYGFKIIIMSGKYTAAWLHSGHDCTAKLLIMFWALLECFVCKAHRSS